MIFNVPPWGEYDVKCFAQAPMEQSFLPFDLTSQIFFQILFIPFYYSVYNLYELITQLSLHCRDMAGCN